MIGPLPNLPCVHLDRGYDSRKTRDLLEILGYHAGTPTVVIGGSPVYRTRLVTDAASRAGITTTPTVRVNGQEIARTDEALRAAAATG